MVDVSGVSVADVSVGTSVVTVSVGTLVVGVSVGASLVGVSVGTSGVGVSVACVVDVTGGTPVVEFPGTLVVLGAAVAVAV